MKKFLIAFLLSASFFLGSSTLTLNKNIVQPVFAQGVSAPEGGGEVTGDIRLNIGQVAKNKEVIGTTSYEPKDGTAGFGVLMGQILRMVVVIAAIILFIYLLWGAIEWVISGGDSSKIEKAKSRITQSILGMIVLAGVIALFSIMQTTLNFTIFNFSGGTTYSGGASTSGSGGSLGGSTEPTGNGDDNCIDNGEPLNTGVNNNYCNTGAAIVKCFPPEGNISWYHYEPCYCVEGESDKAPNITFRSCN